MNEPVLIAAAAVALSVWGAVLFLRGGLLAWNMFLDRPLLGCGLGRYVDESI
jgi:hypothetical protein